MAKSYLTFDDPLQRGSIHIELDTAKSLERIYTQEEIEQGAMGPYQVRYTDIHDHSTVIAYSILWSACETNTLYIERFLKHYKICPGRFLSNAFKDFRSVSESQFVRAQNAKQIMAIKLRAYGIDTPDPIQDLLDQQPSYLKDAIIQYNQEEENRDKAKVLRQKCTHPLAAEPTNTVKKRNAFFMGAGLITLAIVAGIISVSFGTLGIAFGVAISLGLFTLVLIGGAFVIASAREWYLKKNFLRKEENSVKISKNQ